MKIKSSTSIGLALCLAGSIGTLRAQTTNTTQQILQMHTFREGLVLTGDQTPGEAENKELLEVLNHLSEAWWTTGLEQFFKDYPASPWAASLHYDYASYCRRTGRTTKALAQFEAAWDLAKNDSSPQGQRLGGTILANWMDLLASLGRLTELKGLVATGDQWHFVNAQDRDKFQGAKNSFYLMQEHPGIAYRCGTFALKAVGEKLQSNNQALENLPEIPSPTNGFSMASLVDLAKQYGLNLVAVKRSLRTATGGQDIIVPSVVHWRQNHYAAILERQDDSYLVNDPTFGGEKWLPAEVINEEASGEFLIPVAAQTTGWTLLARSETEAIHGMGLPNNINDGKDKGCTPGQHCPPCQGMPVAWVSEPYINLWLADEPLSYLTSRGEPFTFRITYKQRDSRSPTDWQVQNAGWNNSWASYVHLTSTGTCNNTGGTGCMPSLGTCSAVVYLPNGGEVDFAHGQSYDPETRLSLQQQAPAVLQAGGDFGKNGLRLIHADGSQDIYGLGITIPVPFGDYSEAEFLRTRHIAANGDTTWFQYGGSPTVLRFVLDPDGRTNELAYTGVNNNLLSAVTNGYGQSAHFKYDASGNLTNIVDAQGLSSGISYDTNGYPTKLITPYGTTQFSIVQNVVSGQGNFGGHNLIDRAVQITDPISATSLYLYRYDCSSDTPLNMATSFSSGDVPTGTPLNTLDDGSSGGTNSLAAVCYRNSFYWGARQYPALSTTNINNFTANDYIRGRMRHWLQDGDDLNLSGYVSVERAPSPDGSTEGLKTFYDYQGKVFPHRSGTNALPSVTAWRLPGGETHYEYKVFDYFGNVTQDITTCTKADGSPGTRTNQFVYADNTYVYVFGTWNGSGISPAYSSSYTLPNLLTRIIGADGNPVWSYGGFDTVTWTNFFYQGSLTNATTQTALRALPDYATNGLGQVATATYTAGGNAVTFSDMIKFIGSFPNANYGTPFATSFPGYSKVTGYTSVAGLTTTNFYDASGFLARTVDLQTGRTNSFGFGTDGLVTTFTNELGLKLTFLWDNLLRSTCTLFPDNTYISNRFDRLDLGGVRDRLGNWTGYGHDGARHLIVATNANNAVTGYSWCGCGALESVLDALTNLTTLSYDNQGNLTGVSYPDGSSITRQFDLAGRITNVLDGAGRALRLAYNNQGLVTNLACAFGPLTTVAFDVLDRPVVVTDANGVTVTNQFDALNRPVKRTWADGRSESYGYNAAGLIAYTNRDNRVTRYGLDAAGRMIAGTNANNEVVRAGYNPAGEIISLTDGLNHARSWQYNEYGWLTNKVDGLGRNASRYAYNPNGWLTNRWTPEKGNTGYALDNVGNVTAAIYPSSTITYAYNLLNELTNMVDAVGNHNFGWTASGQLQSEDGPWANDTLTYAYAQGLRTGMSVGAWSQSYGYDNGWRLTGVASPAGSFGYGYNFQPASSLVTDISLPNGAAIVNGYDSLARLAGTALNNRWGHTLDGYAYGFDALGLRTNTVRNLGLTSSTVTAGFDNINQLTSWTAKESSGTARLNEQLGYGYDAAHNLHTRVNGGLTQTFTTDAADELNNVTRTGTFTVSGATPAPATSVTVNGLAAQTYGDFTFAATSLTLANGNNTFTTIAQNAYGLKVTNALTVNLPVNVTLGYDNNGNLTNDGAKALMYDVENQLTNVTVANTFKKDFVYDGLNRLRIKREYSWSGSAWNKTNEIRFVWDGNNIVQLRDANNVPTLTLTRGLDLSGTLQGAGGIGGLLAMTDGDNANYYYHADAGGNITALMDAQENMVARRMYDGFGRTIRLTGNAGLNPFWASSQLHDEALDMDSYLYRNLLRGIQRWGSVDPAGLAGGINPYEANRNNPLSYIDPTGKAPQVIGVSYDLNGGNSSALYQNQQFGQGYGINYPPSDPFADFDRDYNRAWDAITPPIDPNTDPYWYAANQTAREMALAGIMGAATGGAGECPTVAKTIDPALVRFSQSSISRNFSSGGAIEDLAAGLRNGSVNPANIPPIRLVEKEGNLISIDNRRLWSFQQADVPIPYRMATPAEIRQATQQGKFSAGELGGGTIKVRGQ